MVIKIVDKDGKIYYKHFDEYDKYLAYENKCKESLS
jgi:hypothetical protein